jgi:catechol 2,3-dioxygenase-like lactoylglutathione lyase family enzyme
MDHLAIPVADQERSRRFYETYFGFGARPARRYDDGVLMLYDAAGFALALDGALSLKRTCGATIDAVQVTLRGRVAVAPL